MDRTDLMLWSGIAAVSVGLVVVIAGSSAGLGAIVLGVIVLGAWAALRRAP